MVEPLGEPVLDVFGNPIVPAGTPASVDPYAVGPSSAVMPGSVPVVEEPAYAEYPEYGDESRPLLDLGPQDLSHDQLTISEEENRERAMAHARARDQALYEQALAAASDGDIPGLAPAQATDLAGRPLRARRRRRIAP
ncbi:MAG TPA: hypothetical protein VGX23_34300 [Actinocrinis sp.]|nr:hypothetical protein [Actinocrinis sp.]